MTAANRVKRLRDESGDVATLSPLSKRPYMSLVTAICGSNTGTMLLSRPALECLLYGGPHREERCRSLFFFFDVNVTGGEPPQTVIHLKPHHSFPDDIVAKGTAPCALHGPFWCSCEPMRCAAQHLLSLLTAVAGVPEGSPIALTVDGGVATPHVAMHSVSREWSIELVGTMLPACSLGPFKLGPMDRITTIAELWSETSFNRSQRTDCCAHCGASTHLFCPLCRCFLCSVCSQLCGGCGRATCRACCNYSEESGSLCFRCLSC